jgi:hypothetical protein
LTIYVPVYIVVLHVQLEPQRITIVEMRAKSVWRIKFVVWCPFFYPPDFRPKNTQIWAPFWLHFVSIQILPKKFHQLVDIGSLELFEDFLGLKLHPFEDFRPRKSSKRCNFRSLKLTFFEEFFLLLFYVWFNCFILQNDINSWCVLWYVTLYTK